MPGRLSPEPSGSALTATGLVRTRGTRRILDGIGLQVARGERLAIIGANGAGKTTLLEVLAGVQAPEAGQVEPGPEQLGWVPQRPALYERLTVRENLALFARLQLRDRAQTLQAVTAAMAFAELGDRADERLDRLSGGWRQRVSLAIGLLGNPSCLLLDEPHTALDPPQRLALWELLDRLAEAGTAIVLTTHDLHAAERHADRVLLLAEGSLRFTGTFAELRAQAGGDDLDAAFSQLTGDGAPSR